MVVSEMVLLIGCGHEAQQKNDTQLYLQTGHQNYIYQLENISENITISVYLQRTESCTERPTKEERNMCSRNVSDDQYL